MKTAHLLAAAAVVRLSECLAVGAKHPQLTHLDL